MGQELYDSKHESLDGNNLWKAKVLKVLGVSNTSMAEVV